MKKFISVFLFGISIITSAQDCKDLFGNQIKDVKKLNNDEFILIADNFKITKVDSNFDTIWHNDYLDTTNNQLNKIQPTFDGGFIGAGGGPAGNLFKFNNLGDTIWSKRVEVFGPGPFGGFGIRDIIQTSDSGYAFIAFYGHNNVNSMIVKTDKNGDTLWARTNILPSQTSFDKRVRTICEMNNGDIVVSGSVAVVFPSSGTLAFLFKLNSNGDSLWAKTYDNFEFNSLAIDINQDFIIAGRRKNSSNAMEPIILKADSIGDTIWTKQVSAKLINCVKIVDGGYAFAGSKESVTSFSSSYLLKTNSNGDSLWSNIYPEDSTDRELNIIYTLNNKDYLLLGQELAFQSLAPFYQIDYRIQVDSLGICSVASQEESNFNKIILSPNPNSGLFSIQLDQEHIGSSYQILDNLGRLIDKGTIRELSQDFDLSEKPKGVYRIQVSNDKALKTLNVVIQ